MVVLYIEYDLNTLLDDHYQLAMSYPTTRQPRCNSVFIDATAKRICEG